MKVYIVYKKEDVSNYEPTVWIYANEKKAREHLQNLTDDYGENSFALIEEKIIT